ncbi:hypothetical protein TBLA_0C04490 [Henningerozyma blattae CBS 6284]|uniref:MARVEL domain-containing protein n=1 Tax=Henningerozyma blattae (strain ATCC 34711 / CBS 6284 / DSM 70876 / NBRC 10599 / NRRL Y-10934 / UCD 77-7) TaxID=1071380 RepID=I2H1J4_HENB6|nr:hypothetical protein TBLA_0C04490 [Tetrapisispora blattae CBS 6284]CCH60246.1 hypothetical protein TBLA_0C04490 [Tetrapisispora blattae CBS 6284]
MLSRTANVLRIINFCFLVIITGMIGKLIESEKRPHSPRVNYCMFAAPFALVTDSFYAIPANFWPSPFAWPILLWSFDFLNFTFTFTAGTVLSVGIRTHSCLNKHYLFSNKITQGSTERCRLAQASIAFYYFSFFIYLVQLVKSSLLMWENGLFKPEERGGASFRNSRRRLATQQNSAMRRRAFQQI